MDQASGSEEDWKKWKKFYKQLKKKLEKKKRSRDLTFLFCRELQGKPWNKKKGEAEVDDFYPVVVHFVALLQ